ncbi:MAG: PssD/Cps14F family polysaccharide biosynthesis glycosyltransferase [Erysipelotrichaceae bacterium]|nr:PssD/Cps14F family polysaccharide biosynthesis glycosyltransferase [Erysipelotrichaceae bacterium]
MKKVIFISSGGGHLEELLALKSLFNEVNYCLITEKTDTTTYLKERFKKVRYLIYGTQDHLLPYLFIFSFNILLSFIMFLIEKPDVVITTGTHTAVPMCKIAHLFHKKVIWIETMANITTGTKAGRMIYPIADKFIVQWPELLEVYPNAECWGSIF